MDIAAKTIEKKLRSRTRPSKWESIIVMEMERTRRVDEEEKEKRTEKRNGTK